MAPMSSTRTVSTSTNVNIRTEAIVKLAYENEIHRRRVSINELSLNYVTQLFRESFSIFTDKLPQRNGRNGKMGREFSIGYTDNEGDYITISTEEEFQEACRIFLRFNSSDNTGKTIFFQAKTTWKTQEQIQALTEKMDQISNNMSLFAQDATDCIADVIDVFREEFEESQKRHKDEIISNFSLMAQDTSDCIADVINAFREEFEDRQAERKRQQAHEGLRRLGQEYKFKHQIRQNARHRIGMTIVIAARKYKLRIKFIQTIKFCAKRYTLRLKLIRLVKQAAAPILRRQQLKKKFQYLVRKKVANEAAKIIVDDVINVVSERIRMKREGQTNALLAAEKAKEEYTPSIKYQKFASEIKQLKEFFPHLTAKACIKILEENDGNVNIAVNQIMDLNM